MLERFLFSSDAQYNLIGNLSGGERRRLYLARLLMSAPNVLVLDEPTNDLDIETLQALENYLEEFSGSVIVVSHDRYFLDRTVDHLFRFEGDRGVRDYPGNYSAFLEIRGREEAERAAEEKEEVEKKVERKGSADAATEQEKPKKLSYREQKELDELEASISEAEEQKSRIEAELATSDYLQAQKLAEKLAELDTRIEQHLERWTELEERRAS